MHVNFSETAFRYLYSSFQPTLILVEAKPSKRLGIQPFVGENDGFGRDVEGIEKPNDFRCSEVMFNTL